MPKRRDSVTSRYHIPLVSREFRPTLRRGRSADERKNGDKHGNAAPVTLIGASVFGNQVPFLKADCDQDIGGIASLSPRERDVLALITEGLGNAEIAERLAISEKTVRNHTSNLFDKLGVWSRAQAIVLAHDRGFCHTPAGYGIAPP